MARKKQRRKQKNNRNAAITKEAQHLISSRRFLYKVGQKIRQVGVVGEKHLRMIVFLAGVTRNLPEKASVLVKGSTSSGKSTIVKEVLQLFPPKCVTERAGLSKTALAYGRGYMGDKIWLMTEYKSAKDAQFLLRMMQSEGHIEHEATTVRGTQRKTKTVKRSGTPVVLTTTTSHNVHPDDETRFLSVYMTETKQQTLAILKAQAGGKKAVDQRELEVWRAATSLLRPQQNDFEDPPGWLNYVAEHLPLEEVRVRRDWKRFLAFLCAVALCRPRPSDRRPLNISFSDYCVAYKIFEPVLVASVRKASLLELPAEELQVSQTIAHLYKETGQAVTIRELAKHLNWREKRVYKYVQRAVGDRIVTQESGTRERNVKRFLPRGQVTRFLPQPEKVLKNNPKIGKKVKYVHPFTGKWKRVCR
jgi:energy-coupling factor transporter ATP-binding protein EcfA2